MDRIDKTLDIIDRILAMVEFEQCTEALYADEEVDLEDWEEEEEDEQDKDTKSHINEEGLPENNLVKCVGVDKEGRGLYVFK